MGVFRTQGQRTHSAQAKMHWYNSQCRVVGGSSGPGLRGTSFLTPLWSKLKPHSSRLFLIIPFLNGKIYRQNKIIEGETNYIMGKQNSKFVKVIWVLNHNF
jgi:hypothetical protein